MNIEFIYNILIFSSIYFILSSGFNLFLKLRGSIDFSYIAIIIFTSYVGIILNNNYDLGILASFLISFILTIPFTFFILYLSKKLNNIYFVIGTFSIYMLIFQFARNLEITGGTMGLSIYSQKLIFNIYLSEILYYLIFALVISVLLIFMLNYFKKTYLFKILEGWGENETSTKSLGIKSNNYKIILILVTTFLASLGSNMNTFYMMYISPDTFWLFFLIPILLISLISFRYSSLFTYITAVFIIGLSEVLRFIPIGDYTQAGYYKEMIFAIIVIFISYIIFIKNITPREI